jgi:hypothetical protein
MTCATRIASFLSVFAMLAMISSARAQENTRNGALLGGATGAVIGGIIGNNKNDQTAEGALIGGAVGAVTGGLIGNHRDRVLAEQQRQAQAARYHSYRTYPAPRAHHSPHYPQPTYQGYPHGYAESGQPTIVYSTPVVTRQGVYRSPARPVSTAVRQPVTMSDVIHMTRNGVSDQVIISRIQANGMAHTPSVDHVIQLSREGVSDQVIAAMQGDGVATSTIEMQRESEEQLFPHGTRGNLMPVPPLKNQRRGF